MINPMQKETMSLALKLAQEHIDRVNKGLDPRLQRKSIPDWMVYRFAIEIDEDMAQIEKMTA